jgi:hypothetical protein
MGNDLGALKFGKVVDNLSWVSQIAAVEFSGLIKLSVE